MIQFEFDQSGQPSREVLVALMVMAFLGGSTPNPANGAESARAVEYGKQTVLPICSEPVRPEMFSHPVILFNKGDIPAQPDMTNVRWKPANVKCGTRVPFEPETWVDFGNGNKLFNLGFTDPLLICSDSLAAKNYFFLGYAFRTSAFPVGSERKLMEMVGRSDETASTVRGQVTVTNYSYFSDSGGHAYEDAFAPGTVNLVLSYSVDGVNYIEAARSTAYVPSIAVAHRPYVAPTIAVEAAVPPASLIRLNLMFNRREPARGLSDLRLLDARLFGSVCVPDQSNPGQCL